MFLHILRDVGIVPTVWRHVDGYVNIYNIDMFHFIIVRNI